MQLVCLDLEGVLVPEIWIEFSQRTGIPELRRTTRDEPDYDKLMKYRLGILAQHKLGLPDIQEVLVMNVMARQGELPGAAVAASTSPWCSEISAPQSRYFPGLTRSSVPSCTSRVSSWVWTPARDTAWAVT